MFLSWMFCIISISQGSGIVIAEALVSYYQEEKYNIDKMNLIISASIFKTFTEIKSVKVLFKHG